MRVPLTVNDFLYRAEAVSAYAAAVAAGEHFLRRASPKVMRVGLAGGAFPLLGCSVGCSGAARRSSRRAVALRTVSAHSPSDSGPVARRASPAARPREQCRRPQLNSLR